MRIGGSTGRLAVSEANPNNNRVGTSIAQPCQLVLGFASLTSQPTIDCPISSPLPVLQDFAPLNRQILQTDLGAYAKNCLFPPTEMPFLKDDVTIQLTRMGVDPSSETR